jgi:hypothetical protein
MQVFLVMPLSILQFFSPAPLSLMGAQFSVPIPVHQNISPRSAGFSHASACIIHIPGRFLLSGQLFQISAPALPTFSLTVLACLDHPSEILFPIRTASTLLLRTFPSYPFRTCSLIPAFTCGFYPTFTLPWCAALL